jgi:hypothetical protein
MLPSVLSLIAALRPLCPNWIFCDIDPVVAAAKLLDLAKMKENIEKLLLYLVFLAIFIDNMDPQSEPPFRTVGCGRSLWLSCFGSRLFVDDEERSCQMHIWQL